MTTSAKEVIANMLPDATADAILLALDLAGLVVVPREPTEAMITAVGSIDFPYHDIYDDMSVSKKHEAGSEIYRAMIAAEEKQG